ncbi:UDP-4-amino-4,6-dideoxy-N-acetyl-beta-L-altrosamine transaminase [Solitalea sp. MAHUQ-68]|uniref:UDP-4-amino-4, 6-dideoxy-N-acetyl-beta-L-altrosamine transaminase n=1 Tax=Solitalea agri TaxID=2953739 RepID=A0A9X2F6U3_9SPHI|nr:UDP-4-amino-4,6-dideoxy-N-acetyl-beta-L-altrosamine transaminase [Solitalea agri]MCO4292938.1 UDP-4-amino-4,6-dideoxy-N-acetyl-beta-L-altrosamine transaminase [Solitalea agri]
MNPIPYGKQHITEEDINAVIEVLKSDYLTQGPTILAFEHAFAQYIGAKYAVAVSNGTAALHLAALALDVKDGDKVITTPITFAASANCIRYCGGEVVFADIDEETYLLDIEKVKKLLEASPKGTYKGIVPVDFAGKAVDQEAFRELADEYGLWIIEDACHAPGGFFIDRNGDKQLCGNGKLADLSIFSFHPVKHIATGEGGMITTDNEELYKKLIKLRTHGITRETSLFENTPEFACGTESEVYPGWYMEMQALGYNYRITDFQAALGLSQLKKADKGLQRRVEIARKYDNAFKDVAGITSQLNELTNEHSGHAYHLYVIQVENRLGLYNYLKDQQIFAQVHYIPTHLMPYYREQGWKEGDFPIAEAYYKRCLSLPMYPSMTDEQQNYVIEKIINFVNS